MPRRAAIPAILVLAAGSVLGGRAAAQENRIPVPTHAQTIAAIAACGVPAGEVAITHEDELQSDIVAIGDLGGTDEARFRCLRKAIHPAYMVEVSAAPQSEAYRAFARREDHKEARAEARIWLKTAGLLDRVPRYDPRQGVKAFARALEKACSIRPGNAFETDGASTLTVRRSFFGDFMTTEVHDQLACLLRMEAASNAQEHDIMLVFVGNAAPGESDR